MNGLRTALRDLPDAVFVDVLESDDAYRIVADLPGATADDVDVAVSAGRLTVEAEPTLPADVIDSAADEPATSGGSGSAYSYARCGRDRRYDVTLPLPPDAAAEGASSSLECGVLQVTLPKRTVLGRTDVDVEGT